MVMKLFNIIFDSMYAGLPQISKIVCTEMNYNEHIFFKCKGKK